MTTELYLILCIVGIILAALASWRIVTKIRYNKINAKNNSIAAGNDVNINFDKNPPNDSQ